MNRLSLAGCLLALASPAVAQTTTDLALIDQEVAEFARASAGVPGGAASPIDRRLRLRHCAAALSLDWHGAQQNAVQVSCPVPGGWRIYVPVRRDNALGAEAALQVARGDAVTVIVAGGGFAVSQQGEALEAGAPGVWIRVRIGQARSEPLRARVLRPGVVGIDLP